MKISFGIDVAQQRMEWDELVDRVRFAEQLGFEGAWGFDHFQPMYGQGPGNCFEGMTTLAALGASTSKIRIGLLVTGVTYRHPSVLCAQAVTVDHVCHGRLDMSFGAAWFEPEHSQLGIGFPNTGTRFDLLEDTLEIVTRLMSGEPVTFQGKTTSLNNAQIRPLPVQRPHPPIWIGGSGANRTLPLVARYADAWHTFADPEQFSKLSLEVDRLAESIGRDPTTIRRASSLSLSKSPDGIVRDIEAWERAGVDYLICGWPSEGREKVAEFAEGILPRFG
ncbi:MAG TPA: LLM class flavin-dependent oxidoreductase [Acidimicrobiales bacterium]|nr:LLM class flavin-dependent oxidoreductase [Acidimicrobiales bacterium]